MHPYATPSHLPLGNSATDLQSRSDSALDGCGEQACNRVRRLPLSIYLPVT